LVNPIESKAEQKRVRWKQWLGAIRLGFSSGGLLEVPGNCRRREMIAAFEKVSQKNKTRLTGPLRFFLLHLLRLQPRITPQERGPDKQSHRVI
jgi:hypothetical protein